MRDHLQLAYNTFRMAEADFVAAELLKSAGFDFQNCLTFTHYQQATEKFFKSYLCLQNGEVPKTHFLEKLNDMCRQVKSPVVRFEH